MLGERMPGWLLAVLGGLIAGVGLFLVQHDPADPIGWLVTLFFGACALMGVVDEIARSRARRGARGEHVPEGDPARPLEILAFVLGAVACAGIALGVASGELPPDREWGMLVVPIAGVAALLLAGGAIGMLLGRRRR
ncbi:hypothetical protein [Homoserinibacter sp. YIM 151385]|uniref:hypothetical protein n=1 Tax=Homoserinibacter sp. YIM 151385 TaxID=2985506 RepID=UPI0022F02891|nr:hypothetical protein [Homoserinibacter sp. YIM 151385]WBU37337.1 hypothetical protein OF852_10480 [Homoserinibacter sp. YIM 151385]